MFDGLVSRDLLGKTRAAQVNALLRDARKMISTPMRWTKDREQRLSFRFIFPIRQLCASGAVLSSQITSKYHIGVQREALILLNDLAREYGFYDITRFNDSKYTTHSRLMTFWDQAIAVTETEKYAVTLSELD